MSQLRIAPLVEGDGEVKAVPVLLRRVVQEINPSVFPQVARAFRHPSGSIRKSGGLERAINAIALRYPGHVIFVLIDSDGDCPTELGKHLLNRAQVSRPDLHVSVVIAHQEYECWLLAAAESLRGKRYLSNNLAPPPDPEAVRDAKGWLSGQLPRSGRYSPTQDQAALTAWIDFELAKLRSRSFRKLWKEIETLMALASRDT
jgi:hypothetical protein